MPQSRELNQSETSRSASILETYTLAPTEFPPYTVQVKTYLVKVDDAMYANWQAQAKRAGVKLAELIRMRMNGDAKAAHKNATRARGTKPRGRRAGVAARGTAIQRAIMEEAVIDAELDKFAKGIPGYVRDSSGTDHHPSCPCAYCESKRKHLKK